METNRDFIKGKQYPYGFKKYLVAAARILSIEYGLVVGWKALDQEKALLLFNRGEAPSTTSAEQYAELKEKYGYEERYK